MQKTAHDLPPMLYGEDLLRAIQVHSQYNPSICEADTPTRLMALSDIYDVFVPSEMSTEIYMKLYLMTQRAFRKKATVDAVRQQMQNRHYPILSDRQGILGGIDCLSVIGEANTGKSRTIGRAAALIAGDNPIEIEKPFTRIIPVLLVQSMHDASLKGLLYEILRQMDMHLETAMYREAVRSRATVDILLGIVARALNQHVCLIVIDECQNFAASKNGMKTVSCITQLLNMTTCAVCFVGTDSCLPFFESVPYLARRTTGLQYGALPYGEYFKTLCCELLSYRYVQNPIVITDGLLDFLYQHSAGLVGNVVSLLHDCQEIAILSGKEAVSIETLSEAYRKRMGTLHGYIEARKAVRTATPRKALIARRLLENKAEKADSKLFDTLVKQAQTTHEDIVSLLKASIIVEEVRL